jgi:hypothetical protein
VDPRPAAVRGAAPLTQGGVALTEETQVQKTPMPVSTILRESIDRCPTFATYCASGTELL